MHIGIDLGGTKIEVIVLDAASNIHFRHRVPTPLNGYTQTIDAIVKLIHHAQQQVGSRCTVGIGMPGGVSPETGLIQGANFQCLNNMPFKEDIETLLKHEVRIENDANCLAISEATDGNAAGHDLVFAIILGTGLGSGIAYKRLPVAGRHNITGEFGHVPLAWMTDDEFPGLQCPCGLKGCAEMYISGTGFCLDYRMSGGEKLNGESIIERYEQGEQRAAATFERYIDRLGRQMALIVNILDPDIFVLGGGISNIPYIYHTLAEHIEPYIVPDTFLTPIVQAKHGDSSGVRGAAWLWHD